MSDITDLRLAIIVEQPTGDPLEYTVVTDNRDRVRWDLVRGRKNWPASVEAPFLFQTILAWSALRRSGVDVGTEPEQFIDRILDIYPVDADGNRVRIRNGQLVTDSAAAVPVDPTQPGASFGS